MRFSTEALLLGTLAVGQAAAATMYAGNHNHAKRHSDMMRAHNEARSLDRRDENALNTISAADSSKLLSIGLKSIGLNPTKQGNVPWIGNDGQFTNEYINESDEDLILVLWGPAGSWVNAIQPQLTISIPNNSSKTVSFPVGWSGAWAPVYDGTKLVNGQIYETWGEGTFAPPYSVVDVSREVNMAGNSMRIISPKCTSDMDTCVFKCDAAVDQCLTGYSLINCMTGSQEGAYYGFHEGAASGGCGGMGDSANLKTYFGYQ